MARLTTFSRLLITVAIVVGVFFAVRHFMPQLTSFGSKAENTEQNQPNNPTADNNSGASTGNTAPSTARSGEGTSFEPTPFNFQAPMPVNGKLKGVVELGATGFNYFIVRVDDKKNWKLEKSEFGASLVYENMATADDIRKGLKQFIADMVAFGVGARDIHFVISSGAKKAEATAKISAALKDLNYYVNEVTPEQEGKLALRATLPASFASRAFVVDIGSGNTKISWLTGSNSTGLEAPGSKYYQDNLPADQAYNRTLAQAKQVPAANRQTCFIIGGIPFELAKQHRNGKERYTVLKAPSAYTAQGAKQEAGLNIYKAVADATGCKQFVFDWDSNFTIGFLLNL